MNAIKLFNEQRQSEIKQRIELAEQKTSAEIVCAVANESGRYDRAESIVGFVVALASLVVAQAIQWWWVPTGDWSPSALSLGLQMPILVAGFVVGVVVASYWHGMRRWFTSRTEMKLEADRAACFVFSKSAIGATDNRCGVLIYLSLFERQVIIMADDAVQNVLSNQRIQELCDLAVSEIKAGRITTVFEKLIDQVETELAEQLPASRELDANELADHLLIAHRF